MTPRRVLALLLAAVLVALAWWWVQSGRSSAPVRRAGSAPTAVSPRSRRPKPRGASGAPAPGPQIWAAYVLPEGVRPAAIARPMLASDAVRDPFARAFAQARLKELRVTVQGVAAGRDPRVLISGRVLRVGDRLDVFTIDAIDREGVVIRGPGGLRVRLRRATAPERSQGRRPPPPDSSGPP